MRPVATPTICLSMIVKNEAHIIKRCLESVLPYIDAWAICDTGSTDGTQEVIRAYLSGLPGRLREDNWIDFGSNRTMALELARSFHCDYTLVIDADEVLRVDNPEALRTLIHDAYRIEMHHTDGLSWPRINLMRSRLNWRYVGIIHEHAQADPEVPEARLAGVSMWTDGDGARGHDPERNARDLAVMQRSVELEPDNARYWFYLAQGYEVVKEVEKALDTYTKRVRMGGNPDEVWYARYRIAQLSLYQGQWVLAILGYWDAFNADPTRAEPLYWLAQGYITREQDAIAMIVLDHIAGMAKPTGAMFLEDAVYDYLRWVQYAATAHNLGRDEDAQDIASRLLASGKAPEQYHEVLDRLAGLADRPAAAAACAG